MTDLYERELDQALTRFANYIKRHEKTGLGHPLDNQAAIKQELLSLHTKAVVAERERVAELAHGAIMQKCQLAADINVTDPNWYNLAIRKELDDRLAALQATAASKGQDNEKL